MHFPVEKAIRVEFDGTVTVLDVLKRSNFSLNEHKSVKTWLVHLPLPCCSNSRHATTTLLNNDIFLFKAIALAPQPNIYRFYI